MDFQQLLKQAKAKQTVVEKKHVQQKTKKEVEKRQKEVIEAQKQREASEKIKRLKEAAARRQLEHKGLHKPSKALPPSTEHATPHSSKSSSSSSKPGKSGGSKPKKADSGKSKASKDAKPSSKDSSKTKSKDISSTKSSKPAKQPPAVNFNDLMKMAKRKKDSDKSDYPPRRSSSPLGKSLLEKGSTKTLKPAPSRPASLPKGATSLKTSYTVPQSPVKKVTVDVVRHPCSPKVHPSKGAPTKMNGQSVKNGRTQSSAKPLSKHGPPGPFVRRQDGPPRPSGKGSLDSSARKAAIQRRKAAKSAQPTAFYGSAASRILGHKDGGSSRGAPLRYTSTWVDEMRGELEFEDYDDLSDEDDLDGFVVDSEDDFIDDGDEQDYSSHIRKIFGYDKRRFDDERFDDRIMESSFAQQQFEEERSARIGKLEDDEDIKREQAENARKRKRKQSPVRTYGKTKLKQTKLSFR